MTTPIQSRTRGAIRRDIGSNLGIMIDGTATSTVDTSSLLATRDLIGGDDEFNGREVVIYDAAGSIVDGESSVVSDFASATNDATCAPVFSASITTGDKFEMWKTPWRSADINGAINQAIDYITRKALQPKQTVNNFTLPSTYEYSWLAGFAAGDDFTHVSKVEYAYSVGTEKDIDLCNTAWSELVDADVTASVETSYLNDGANLLKLVAAANLGAGDIMATQAISSLDLSGCNQAIIWIRSSVALAAGDLQLLLDDTASCASAVESLDIPATLANTDTWHVIDLANPNLDSAIISVGIKQVVDKGAFTLRVDNISAVNSASIQYLELPSEYWSISKSSTPYLTLTSGGLSVTGNITQIRITGYEIPARLDADTDVSEIDPGWLVARVTGRLLVSHAKSARLDIDDRKALSAYWLNEAAKLEPSLTPNMPSCTKRVM